MKKLISVILALTLAAAMFTGCVDKSKENQNSDSQVSPSPSPETTVKPSSKPDVKEEDPNYPTVLAMWKDMNGYWANENGEYMRYALDKDGKAVLYKYNKEGNLIGYEKATSVMASSKTSYYVTYDIPEIKNVEEVKDLNQDAGEVALYIDMEKYAEGFVSITGENEEDKPVIYVKVGNNIDNLEKSIEKLKNYK